MQTIVLSGISIPAEEDMGHVFLAHNFSRATQFLGDASRL